MGESSSPLVTASPPSKNDLQILSFFPLTSQMFVVQHSVPVTLRCSPECRFAFQINGTLLLRVFPGIYSKPRDIAQRNAENSNSGDRPEDARF